MALALIKLRKDGLRLEGTLRGFIDYICLNSHDDRPTPNFAEDGRRGRKASETMNGAGGRALMQTELIL